VVLTTLRIAMAAGAPRRPIEVMRAIALEVGRFQTAVREIAALSEEPVAVEARRELAVLEVLPASAVPEAEAAVVLVAAVAGAKWGFTVRER